MTARTDEAPVRILVVGAGVIGSLYSSRLAKSPRCQVTLHARGVRLAQIRAGVRFKQDGVIATTELPVVEALPLDTAWDYVLCCVRYEQAEAALAEIAQVDCPTIVSMVNNPGDYSGWEQIVGPGRLMVAFPGAGGSIDPDGVLDADPTPAFIQRTTLGEVDGAVTPRLQLLRSLLRQCGFATAVTRDIAAWQLSHLALVVPLADAINACPSATHREIAENRAVLEAAVRELKECFATLRRCGVRPEPRSVALLGRLPAWVLAQVVAAAFRHPLGDKFGVRHARSARLEMEQLGVALRAAFLASQ